MTSQKTEKNRRKKLDERRRDLIKELWGKELETLSLWSRHEHDGFSTIPRTLPHIIRIIDALSGAGAPLGTTYTSLWCRVSDEGFVEIKDKEILAYESGFGGQRAVTTWQSRMKKLSDLGFISSKPGLKGDFQYVLILNPLSVIKGIYDEPSMTKDSRYHALFERMQEVGAEWD